MSEVHAWVVFFRHALFGDHEDFVHIWHQSANFTEAFSASFDELDKGLQAQGVLDCDSIAANHTLWNERLLKVKRVLVEVEACKELFLELTECELEELRVVDQAS